MMVCGGRGAEVFCAAFLWGFYLAGKCGIKKNGCNSKYEKTLLCQIKFEKTLEKKQY
jgi:hypothetical protein